MFDLNLSEKCVSKGALDERDLITRFIEENSIDRSRCVTISSMGAGTGPFKSLMICDGRIPYRNERPVIVFKTCAENHLWHENPRHYKKRPMFLVGAFLGASQVENVKNLSLKSAMTFSDIKKWLFEQNDVVEGGVVPVKATSMWMKKDVAAYFATGRTLFHEIPKTVRQDFFPGSPI